ncbi:extensin family protein [Nguyenibacter sp. L1]|uniref:extensin-like domain-containing protein n=1 Tax=Nguyenibacter sp. L1 TaxID=3049350 RepID=UPI002B485651|nr:extensin family protein [Nguyenibacter sp. L1]WRH89143.1 extensin family protein [Nguyenibacter sp. L1]
MRFLHFAIFITGLAIVAMLVFHSRWLPPSYDPALPLDLRAPRTVMTPLKLRITAFFPEFCRAALRTAPLRVKPQASGGTATCPLSDIFTVSGGPVAMEPESFLASCDLAVRWALFETDVALPVARSVFGTRLARIRHVGSFACRDVRDRPGIRSSHATANAIDVSAFVLADGREIPLSAWNGQGVDAVFLRRIRDESCGVFETVLSPDYDRLHASHFHFQATGFGLCR